MGSNYYSKVQKCPSDSIFMATSLIVKFTQSGHSIKFKSLKETVGRNKRNSLHIIKVCEGNRIKGILSILNFHLKI